MTHMPHSPDERGHERAKGTMLVVRETCQKRAKSAMIECAGKPAKPAIAAGTMGT